MPYGGENANKIPRKILDNPAKFLFQLRKRGSFGKGVFSENPFLEILENLEILETPENPQTVENKGESDHFLEILKNLENLELLEIPQAKRPLF